MPVSLSAKSGHSPTTECFTKSKKGCVAAALAQLIDAWSGLLRGGRERRQFANVAPVVLDDDDCFQIRCDLLEAVERSYGRCAIGVKARHAVAVVVFMEVSKVAGEQHIAVLFQPDQQAVMARCMPGHVQHDDGAVAERSEEHTSELQSQSNLVCRL